MVGVVLSDSTRLVRRHGKHVGEATAAINHGLAGHFGIGCSRAGVVLELSRAHGRDVRTTEDACQSSR